MYVHSVTVYVNRTGMFHPFTSPDPAVNFPAATGTSGKPVSGSSADVLSLSLSVQSAASKVHPKVICADSQIVASEKRQNLP